jgi:aldehyde:ferredoxin oxidoreductase
MVLGRQVTAEELKKTGGRIYNLARLFNQREGFDRKDDTLPERIFTEKLPRAPPRGGCRRGSRSSRCSPSTAFCGAGTKMAA